MGCQLKIRKSTGCWYACVIKDVGRGDEIVRGRIDGGLFERVTRGCVDERVC